MNTTINYTADDYSGRELTATIEERTFNSSNGFTGTFKTIDDNICMVIIEGVELSVYRLGDNVWYCQDSGISRDSYSPIIAALQVAHNTI